MTTDNRIVFKFNTENARLLQKALALISKDDVDHRRAKAAISYIDTIIDENNSNGRRTKIYNGMVL
jgi:hypothetical protein